MCVKKGVVGGWKKMPTYRWTDTHTQRQPSMWCVPDHRDANSCLHCHPKTHRIQLERSACVQNHTHTHTHTHTSSSLASTLMRCVGVQQSPLTIPTSPLPLPAVSPSPWYSAGGAEGGGPTSLISYPKNKAAPPTRRLPLPLERLKKKKTTKMCDAVESHN